VDFRDCCFRGKADWEKLVDKINQLKTDSTDVTVGIYDCVFEDPPVVAPVEELQKALSTTDIPPRALTTTLGRPTDMDSALDEKEIEEELHNIIAKGPDNE
jgi:hypothetical protein